MPSRREFFAGLSGVALSATAGCLGLDDSPFSPGSDASTDWPMARYDPANTAFAPDAATPRTDVQERWAVDLGFDVRTPAISGGTVFAPTAEGLVALDGETGEEQWSFTPTDQPWPSPPLVHDGVVYVTMRDDDTLHAVDAKTGEKRWSRSGVGSEMRTPFLLDGHLTDEPHLLVSDADGVVRALDPVDGRERWRLDVFGAARTMAYDGRVLSLGTIGGEVYAYAPRDEDEAPREYWRQKVDSQIESLVPTDNGLIVGSFGGPLRNLRPGHAGTIDWVAQRPHSGSPPVHAGSWVFSAGHGSLSSLRTYDRNLHWRVSGDFGTAGPVAAGDTLYVPGRQRVAAFALSGGVGGSTLTFGAKRWEHTVSSGGIQGLAVGDGALFVACEGRGEDGPTLYCLEAP